MHIAYKYRASYFWRILIQTLLVAWVCLLGHAQAQANAAVPVVLQQGGQSVSLDGKMRVWIDKTGQTTIDSVHALGDDSFDLLPQRKDLKRDGNPLWFRIVLSVQQGENPWFLSVREITTNDVDLYTQNSVGAWVVQKSGTAVPVAKWPLPGFRPTFQLSTQPSGTRTLYLRVADPIGSYADVQIAPLQTWTQERTAELWLMGLFFGATLVVLLLCLLNFISYREPIWLSYSLYSASMAMVQGGLTGLCGQFFYPDHAWFNNFSYYFWAGAVCIFGIVFALHSSTAHVLARRWTLAMLALAACIATTLLVLAYQPSVATLQFLYGLQIIAVFLIIATFALCWKLGDRFSQLALLAFVPLGLAAAPQMLYNFALLPRSWFTQYSLTFGVTIETVLMMYFLHRRSRLGAVTRSRLMATDQDDSLTGLLKARETLYRLDGMLKRTRNGQKNMGAVLLGLVNFETIRRAHGREVADTALIVMAQHIKSICSDLDISGRVDSNQFLICLEGHLVEDKLKSVGSALIAKGLRQSKFLPLGVTLDFALVLSMLDGYEPNANDVLKQMADKYDEINPNDTKRVLHCRVRGLAPDDADVWPA